MTDQREFLNRERFQALPKPRTTDVYVEDWGTNVHVRGLSAGIALDIIAFAAGGEAQDILRVPGLITRIVIDAVVDDDGVRVFTQDDFAALDGQPINALMPIVMAAIDLTNLGGDAEKNSRTGQSAGSSSA